MEQGDYLADWIVQVNAPIFICPAVFPGQLRPAQDKGVQNLCFVGQGCECGGFKKEIYLYEKPGLANMYIIFKENWKESGEDLKLYSDKYFLCNRCIRLDIQIMLWCIRTAVRN